MTEVQATLEGYRSSYPAGTPGFRKAADKLLWYFPHERAQQYAALSMPSKNSVLGEDVITAILPEVAIKNLFSSDVMVASRKFCTGSGTSFVRIYRLPRKTPKWMPRGSTILAEGVNDEEWGRPAPQGIIDLQDFYFVGRPREIENQLGLPPRRGKYKTCYGVTIKVGIIQRVKQYLYDEPDSFSEWERLYEKKMRDIGRSA